LEHAARRAETALGATQIEKRYPGKGRGAKNSPGASQEVGGKMNHKIEIDACIHVDEDYEGNKLPGLWRWYINGKGNFKDFQSYSSFWTKEEAIDQLEAMLYFLVKPEVKINRVWKRKGDKRNEQN
jgi:hypothetical protein